MKVKVPRLHPQLINSNVLEPMIRSIRLSQASVVIVSVPTRREPPQQQAIVNAKDPNRLQLLNKTKRFAY